MYRLDRFNIKHEPLKYTMPWARIIKLDSGNAIVLNKDGSMQTTFAYRGPDLDSAIKEQLAIITQQLNSAIMSINTGWVLYFEAQRIQSTDYLTDNYFPDIITQSMDDERREFFSRDGTHFETNYFCTMYWLPPNDNEGRLRNFVVEGNKKKGLVPDDYINAFSLVVDKLYRMFLAVNIPCHFLTLDETLAYLHQTVNR